MGGEGIEIQDPIPDQPFALIVSLVPSSVWNSSSVYLLTLTSVRNTSLVFYRMSHFGFVRCLLLRLDSEDEFLAGTPQRNESVFLIAAYEKTRNTCLPHCW